MYQAICKVPYIHCFTEWVIIIPGGTQYYYPSFIGNEAENRRLEKLSNFPNVKQHVSEGAMSP